jgi:hypothetical protein
MDEIIQICRVALAEWEALHKKYPQGAPLKVRQNRRIAYGLCYYLKHVLNWADFQELLVPELLEHRGSLFLPHIRPYNRKKYLPVRIQFLKNLIEELEEAK